jgi:cytoskeletal protein CcmA (bactofilin family)
MWGKTNESSFKPLTMTPVATGTHNPPAPERVQSERVQAPPPPPARVAASIGKSTRIRGEVYSEEELYFDGEIDGSIEVRNLLTIGPNGKVKANVKAKELVVRGSIQGGVEAIDRISIMNGASIVGDVKTAGIVIEDGAYFKGGIDILRPEPARPESAHAGSDSARPESPKAANVAKAASVAKAG